MNSEEKTGQHRPRPAQSRPGSGSKRKSAQSAKRRAPAKSAAQKKRTTPAQHRKAARPSKAAAERKSPQADRRRSARRPRRTADTPRRNIPPRTEAVPEVVYTPAKQFNRNRFLLQIATMLAVVVALVFAFSIFFKVKTITVSGADKYDAWTVREASGIQEGEGLLTFGQTKAAGRIRATLPYVKDVRIGIKLPDTVNIEIVESELGYAIAAADGTWWLMTAEGRILEQTDEATSQSHTRIEGITLAVPVGEQALAYEEIMQNAFGETIPASVTAQERMDVVTQILQNLEMNGIMGDVTLIDVSVPANLQLWFGEKYQIKLGDSSRLPYKIESMQSVFLQEEFLEAGIIDVSFSDDERPKDVIFIPFVQ